MLFTRRELLLWHTPGYARRNGRTTLPISAWWFGTGNCQAWELTTVGGGSELTELPIPIILPACEADGCRAAGHSQNTNRGF